MVRAPRPSRDGPGSTAAAGARGTAAEALRAAARARTVPALGASRTRSAPPAVVDAVAARTRRTAPRTSRPLLYGAAPADDAALVRLADDLDALRERSADRERPPAARRDERDGRDRLGDEGREALRALRAEVAKAVVGQDAAVTGLVIALLCRGHVLLEGVPGVAKTLLVRTLSAALDLGTKRVQFTPDLMPGDVTGSLVYDARTSAFSFREGPVFTNLLLADEINRTPPKTQAALLEAMEERQVTVEGEARALPDPFLVVATQNPVEYEGTYPLPEAQLDRFLLKLTMPLPPREDEVRRADPARGGVRPA